jgi:hypothetical protein
VGTHVRIALVVGAVALGGCGRKPPRPEPFVQRAPVQVAPRPVTDFYDRDGNIRGSGVRVEWLEMPAGFAHVPKLTSADREVYQSDTLPFDKVNDFLGKRMFTGKVDLGSNHAVYPAIMPLDMNENAMRLNVSVTRLKGVVTLMVERVRRVEVKPLSEDEARQILSKEMERVH